MDKQSSTKQLLKYLATGGVIAVLSLANPILPYSLLKAYFKHKKFQKWKFLQDLSRLQNRKLIDYQELSSGEVSIVLKGAGQKLALKYDIDNIKIKRPKIWDGKWRLIIFDIPNKKRAASNAINLKLKELGFHKLQKSVFIHPFSCANEIEFIASLFNIRNHILIIDVSHFEGSEKLRRYYKI